MPPEQLVYLDETGMDNHEAHAYGWSPQGEPCWDEKPGQRTQRVSLIDALHQQELIAPWVFEGTCNTALFDAYVAHGLVPVLKPGQIVIYDNASFHQSAKARRLIAGAGCTQKFLPPYSPISIPLSTTGSRSNNASASTCLSTTAICTRQLTPCSPNNRHLSEKDYTIANARILTEVV